MPFTRKAAVRRLVVISLACLLWACDYIGASRPPWLISATPPQRTYYPTYSYRHTRERAHSSRARSSPRESSASLGNVERSPTVYGASEHPMPAPAPAEKPPAPVSLSMAGDSSDRARAQQLLEQTDKTLGNARARHLTRAEKETYERASLLASRARHALADNDCAAASSLAGKALSLASGIGR